MLYEYRASLVRVVDADTLDLCVDLGFGLTRTDRFRLFGLNAPELRTPEGKLAAAWVADWLAAAGSADRWPLVVRTEKDRREKYGRYLGVVLLAGRELNAELLAAGHAAPVTY